MFRHRAGGTGWLFEPVTTGPAGRRIGAVPARPDPFGYPVIRPRRRRTRRVSLALAACGVLVVASTVALGWAGVNVARARLSPSADPQLALLRRVAHPADAVEVGHRTQRGRPDAPGTAWLTYRTVGPACPAALITFIGSGVREAGIQSSADPVKAHCGPAGDGIDSLCLPNVVCFLADFTVNHNPREYTISTGPNGQG